MKDIVQQPSRSVFGHGEPALTSVRPRWPGPNCSVTGTRGQGQPKHQLGDEFTLADGTYYREHRSPSCKQRLPLQPGVLQHPSRGRQEPEPGRGRFAGAGSTGRTAGAASPLREGCGAARRSGAGAQCRRCPVLPFPRRGLRGGRSRPRRALSR